MSCRSARRARRSPLAGASLCLLLAGCESLSSDHGFDRVAALTAPRLKRDVIDPSTIDDATLRRRVDAIVAAPLSADAAVEIALLSNRRLRATYRDLGVAEADLVQASRLPNPGIEFKHTRGGDATVIERTFLADLSALIAMPFALSIERGRVDEVRLAVGDAVLRTAAAARRAWVEAVAAETRVALAERTVAASDAASDLAGRMRAAGNWSALSEAREQAFAADARAALVRERQARTAKREQLTRVLGLSTDAYRLPPRLPEPPATPLAIGDVEARALRDRLDLEADRVANRRLAASLGLSRATRFVNAFEVARDADDRRGEPPERGYEVRIEVPLFDFGDARVAKADALAAQAVERTAAHAIDAASEVRERYAGYRSAWELARHYRTVVLPMRQRIAAENLVRYDGMLIGVFELVADAREQAAAAMATQDALRDFWIAETDLGEALGGALPDAVETASRRTP